jgi:hypothetical protein
MNANHELERRLADFYETEAAQRAPDRVLQSVLATTNTTKQRRAVFRLPWRFPIMNSYARMAIAAVAVIAIGALGLTVFRGGTPPGPGVIATSSPDPSPSSLPSASRAPIPGSASIFVRPFDYLLPVDPQFEYGPRSERSFEIRVPQWFEEGHMGGLIVQAVRAGLVDRCDAESAPLELEPGPQAVFDYLATIPEFTVGDVSATTVDGRPARQATVIVDPGPEACPEIRVWADAPDPVITEVPVRLIAVDVDGERIVITIFGERENPELPALADEFVASMRFQPVASPAQSP